MSHRGSRSSSREQQKLRRGNVLIRFTLDHPESQDHVTKKLNDAVGERKSDISVSYRHRRRSHQNTPPVTFMTSSSPHLDSSSPSISVAPSGDKTKNGRWKGTAEWDSPSAGYDVTDGDGCLVSCFPNCKKPNYRGGQTMTGTVLIKPVHRVTICGVFVKMWGIESTKWRSRERVYYGERIFFKQMVVIVKNRLTNLDTKWYKYDFEYQLPADLPPSFKMADGSRRYRACAVISQPYGHDLEGHQVGFSLVGNTAVVMAPYHLREEYEIRFSTNQPSTHVKCSCRNKSKTPPTSTIPPSLPSSPPVMTTSSRSTLYQRSLSKLSSSSSSPWSSFTTITSACTKFLRCSCCCKGGGANQMMKYRSGQIDQSCRSNDDLDLEPCGHLGRLLRFNSDINSNNEVPPPEVERDVQQVKEAISGSLRISGRVFAPLDTVNVLCTVENQESSSDLLCCLKLIRIAKFTAREASHPSSRKGFAHPRKFKIEPKTKMAEEELLKTEEISVQPGEIRCFGFRFTVPYKIIGNTTPSRSNQTNSRESLGSNPSTDTADDELISLFYFCLMEIQPTSSNSSAGLDVIAIPIEIRFVDRIQDT